MNFNLECTQLLQNDFFKQRYITFNAIIPGQDRFTRTPTCAELFLLGICSENKGADQLRGNREADLRLCFRMCNTLVSS